jgi:predicted AlkP superfamily phosphohydrolase/phosphomutase
VIHRAKEESQQRTTGRALVIGLDGATFDLIEPWAEAGHLPNLARLMAEGAWGRMRSTIPAHSAPAWVTFATGLLPGRHGIYWFLGPTRDQHYFRPVSSESIHSRTLWELISEQDQRVGVMNVPLTYPPRPVNGYLISGVLSPDARSAFWPPELYEEVRRRFGEYVVEVYGKLNRRAHLEAMIAAIDRRSRVAEYLMDRHPVSFFMVMFRMLDSVQHKFWADMDPHHPLHGQLGDGAMPEAVLTCYRSLDATLPRLLKSAGPETTVFIVSDHGFRGEYRRLAVNRWLRDQQLAAWQRRPVSLVGQARAAARRLGLSRAMGNLVRTAAGARYRRAFSRRAEFLCRSIDWSRTKVLYGPNFGFNINLQGRDFEGVVPLSEYEALRDHLIEGLKALRDPETGLPMVAEVYRREEVYEGEALDLAPDVIPQMAEYTTDGRRWGFGIDLSRIARHLVTPPTLRTGGNHAPDGIFLAYGPHVRGGEVNGLHIADMAPTVLYAMGLAVPKTLDGQVRTELFAPAYTSRHPVWYEDFEVATESKAGQVLSAEHEAVIEERLKGLGYL